MRRGILVTIALAAGCGSGGGAPDAAVVPPDAGPYSYRTCDPAIRVGDFKIQLEESFTAVSGVVYSGVSLADVPVLVRQEGDCRLLQRRNLFCNPACDGQSTCAEDRRCIPAPVGRSAGTVHIAGLATPVAMMPGSIGQHYDYTKLPHPGFQPGAQVLLWATGGEVPPFVLQGQGVVRVELADSPMLEPGKDFQLRWTAGPAGPARMFFQIEIDQHGNSKASLQCDVPDQGAATVGAALIDELIKLGTSGFPKVTAARRTADATMSSLGCVELQVMTAVERPLTVSGHQPCMTDAECPAGKTCDRKIQTCR